jgi:hypothetical protein
MPVELHYGFHFASHDPPSAHFFPSDRENCLGTVVCAFCRNPESNAGWVPTNGHLGSLSRRRCGLGPWDSGSSILGAMFGDNVLYVRRDKPA